MSKFAWVTLTTNDTYSLGALVLANSLKRVHTAHQLAVLVTPGVSEAMRNKLKDAFNVVQEVDILDSKDSANLALLARPELGITFTKLHCWRLVQFEKCVFLDADTVVLKNCDELFEREEFSAAPDVSWPDCFNSGVFVFRPSIETFGKITDFAVKHGSFDGGDQGLLNLFFSDWAHKDISKHLPFTYNTAALASYCYLPAFKQFRDQIKIIHFCGKLKPWFVPFNAQSNKADIPSDYAHASDIIQTWWTIFSENVHDKLNEQMLPETYEVPKKDENDFYGAHGSPDIQEVITNIAIYNDPWDDYYLRQKQIEEEEKQKKLELQRLREEEDRQRKLREIEARRLFEEELERTRLELEELEVKRREVEEMIYQQRRHEEERQIWEEAQRKEREEAEERIKRQQEEQERTHSEQKQRERLHEVIQEEQVQEPEHIVQNHVPEDESTPEAGLAGALSSLKLGEHERTPEQEAYEHLMRRQLWETGNIDYCGKDSFDNIMKQITKTLEEKPTKPEEEETKKSEDDDINRPTSDQIQDGKVEYDEATGATIEYKLIKGGYEVKTTTPQPNGTRKMQVQTFWDPMPADELKKVIAEHNASNKKPNGTIERVDKNTTVEYRDIEGGHEEITTTIMEDGTKSIKKKTFYDAKISDDSEPAPKHIQQQQNKNKAVQKKDVQNKAVVESHNRKAALKKTDSTDSTSSSHFEQKTVEEHRKVTQTSVKTSHRKNSVQSVEMVSSRKNSLVEEYQAIEAPKEKTKKKKTKGVPAPPPDFIENDSTVVTSKKVNGGTEYNYTTTLEDGRTVTTTKIVYEEEEVEMTEEEIQQYKKELKDAEKHKDITRAIKLKSPSGTKKVIPSENPGEVTTVETIKFEGYTEFHYSTVCADGVVKHSTKTVYDAVQSVEDDEEEIVEEIEEEIIEPGETIVKTFESTKLVEKNYAETVVTKSGKKTKKIVA